MLAVPQWSSVFVLKIPRDPSTLIFPDMEVTRNPSSLVGTGVSVFSYGD